jgi:hypothetical protein
LFKVRPGKVRFKHRISTESEAIRRLIELGLKAEAPAAAPPRTRSK